MSSVLSPELVASYNHVIALYKETGLGYRKIARALNLPPYLVGSWIWKYQHGKALQCVREFSYTIEAKELLDGLLLADGSLQRRKHGAIYRQSFALRYIGWATDILSRLDSIGIDGKLTYRWSECRGEIFPGVTLFTHSYRQMLHFYDRWYSTGRKVVPQDISLTPLACLLWYLGDGSFCKDQYGYGDIHLYTDSFSVQDLNFLLGLLHAVGLANPSIIRHQESHFYICLHRNDDVVKFFDFIDGIEIPSCFGYKFKEKIWSE